MRKLGRILRRALTALSLLLLVAVLAAWVRGYWSWDTFWTEHESMDVTGWRWAAWYVEWGGGEAGVSRLSFYADADKAPAGTTLGVRRKSGCEHRPPQRICQGYVEIATDLKSIGGMGWTWDRGGVALGRLGHRGTGATNARDAYFESSYLAFPCWMAAIVFGALPSWRSFVWWRGVRRRRLASRAGRCGMCGYDLRASPQRCPECGTAVGQMQKREARSEKRGENANIEH